MEIRILGPLEVVHDGRAIAIASQRQRALLALLVVHAGRPVSTERILDALWGDSPPDSGSGNVAPHVSRLRTTLQLGVDDPGAAPDRRSLIATEAGGYTLRIEPEAVAAVRFERLAGRATSSSSTTLPRLPASCAMRMENGVLVAG